MKYIDAEKLIAEIEKLLAKAKNDEEKAFAKKDAAGHLAAVTKTVVCVKIKKLIASLQQEQPEVDLEKEFNNFLDNVEGVPRMWHSNEQIEWVKEIAKHFYELGLNARKEE